ncbi:MAG: hypothetical protein KME31_18725 [Tolypothrix carrinoi HA7290-LM1]|nr:hypothetical protein [Tolypothrix carrinoi HA7290-LM1]
MGIHEGFSPLPIPHSLLPITHSPFPITYSPFSITHYPFPIPHYPFTTPTGQATFVPPKPQYPPGFLARYC